ncbi:MAG: glycosyltransferase family 39 protein [Bacteroidetes bacterium]|nr:glycosyltransferase family 39 protein [Bacteroidota bacterium]
MKRLFSSVPVEIIIFAIQYSIFQIIAGLNYPIFRDEFYYLDCAKHLSFGYVDHPAFSVLILKIWITIFGDSQLSIRIIPALLGASLFVISALINKEVGGNKYSLYLSCICILYIPTNLANCGYYSMNSWEIVIWTLLFYILIRLINSNDKKLWIYFGIIAGIGFNNKIGILILLASILISLLFTKEREYLKSKYFWIGAVIIFLSLIPYALWNYFNDFATQQFISNAAKYKNADFSLAAFIKSQITDYGPINFIIWLTALVSLLFLSMKKYRVIAFIFLICFIMFSLNKAKPYYLEGLYPVLITIGSVVTIKLFERKNLHKFKIILPVIIFFLGLIIIPLVTPVLSPDNFIAYQNKLGVKPGESEKHEQGILPQFFADRFGWTEMTAKVTAAYNSLPESERKFTGIYAQNYGEAGAINYYGRKYNLPEVLCGHNNHYLWGAERNDSINTLIIIGGELEDHLSIFEEVSKVDSTSNKYSMPYENNLPIYIARKPKVRLKDIWKDTKHYI